MNTQSRYKIQAPFASEGDPNNPPGDLGEGSYGVVYKALDLLTNTEVALKKIKMENQVDGISSSTLREITFLRQLKHENVIVLRDVEMHNNGRICLVFDLEDGDLAKLLSQSKEPFSAEAVQSYGAQIMSAVAYCHSMGVMHRDLKPQNILVSRGGRLKLADFGLARAISPFPRPLTLEVITTWYRAPEVLLGHRYYDPSVDVWSAVCIIAEMSNRRVLFHGFKSDIDQIHTIFRLLGTPTPDVWPGLEDIPYWRQTFPVWPARSVASLVPNMSPDGADFMSRVLRYDARSRMSAKAALQHPYLRNFVQSPMSAARALRAPQVSSGQAHLGAYSIAQAQAGLSGAGLPASAAVHVENVPVVSLFNSGAALASRCSSAVSFLDDSFTSTGYAPSVNGEDSNSGLFQPIGSGDLASATAAASTSSAAAGAMSAPRPSARSASTTASTTRAAAVVSTAVPAAPVVPVAVLPRAARPVESQAVQAANEHRAAFAAVTSGARAAAASSQPATASAQSGAPVQAQIPVSRSSNRLNADIVAEAVPQSIPAPITVTLPIPVQARVQVPVVAAASSRSVSSMRGTAAESHAGKPAAAAPSSAPSAAVRRTTQVVTEDSAAELFEPLRTHSRAKKTAPTSAKELRARGLSTDSTSSIGLSGINTALEGDLDSSMEWGEDSQDGHAFTSSGENNKTAPVTQAGASAAAAAQNKGRFNKRKFGSPLPSRPASAVFFSSAAATVPASAEVTAVVPDAVTTESAPAPQAARTRKRRAEPLLDGDSHLSLSVDIAPAPTKYAKVTPEAAAAGSGGRDELYWGAGSGDTPAGKFAEKQTGKDEKSKAERGKAAAKAPAAVAAAAPVVAVPVRRSTRGAK